MIQNAIVIRRTVANAQDLRAGALVLAPGQWGFATSDKLLVVRDLVGNFHDIPCVDLLPDLLRVKTPVADLLSLPVGKTGDMVFVQGVHAYHFYDGSAWIRLADSASIAALLDAHVAASDPHSQYVLGTEIGQTVCPLENGAVPSRFLPGSYNEVQYFNTLEDFPATGADDVVYLARDTRISYMWGGESYEALSASLALGETANTAYRGDRGAVAYAHSQATGNPHQTAIGDVSGLAGSLSDKISKTEVNNQYMAGLLLFPQGHTVYTGTVGVDEKNHRNFMGIDRGLASGGMYNRNRIGGSVFADGWQWTVGDGSASIRMQLESDGSGLTVNAPVNAGRGLDGEALLRLNADRPWAFVQSGSDSSAHVHLKCESDSKSFRIVDNANDVIADFYAQSGGNSNTTFKRPLYLNANSIPAAADDSFRVPSTSWVRDRLGDVTVTNADKVDGKHIVVQAGVPSSPSTGTLYFCY